MSVYCTQVGTNLPKAFREGLVPCLPALVDTSLSGYSGSKELTNPYDDPHMSRCTVRKLVYESNTLRLNEHFL